MEVRGVVCAALGEGKWGENESGKVNGERRGRG